MFPPYRGAGEAGGGLEQAGAGVFLATPSPFLPPRNTPIFFEWCFGNISKCSSNILHTVSAFPWEWLSVQRRYLLPIQLNCY